MYILFLLIIFGWIIAGSFFIRYFNRKVKKIVVEKENKFHLFDYFFFFAGLINFVLFFMIEIIEEIKLHSSSIFEFILALSIVFVLFFGILGFFGYIKMHYSFKFMINCLFFYVGSLLLMYFIITAFKENIHLFKELLNLYSFFLLVLFPLEIGYAFRVLTHKYSKKKLLH